MKDEEAPKEPEKARTQRWRREHFLDIGFSEVQATILASSKDDAGTWVHYGDAKKLIDKIEGGHVTPFEARVIAYRLLADTE